MVEEDILSVMIRDRLRIPLLAAVVLRTAWKSMGM